MLSFILSLEQTNEGCAPGRFCIEAVREKGYIRDRNKELSEDFM